MTNPRGPFTPGVTDYESYNRQYVQPSAALHEELLRRFAFSVDTGVATFRNETLTARPDPFGWGRKAPTMVPAPSYVGPIAPDPVLPPGVQETTRAANLAAQKAMGIPPLGARSLEAPTAEPTKSRGAFGERGAFGRMSGAQAQPSELSDYDLWAEARELGVASVESMPRPMVEKAVKTLRTARQAKNSGEGPLPQLAPETILRSGAAMGIGMLESLQNAAELWGFDGSKTQTPDARGWLSTIFHQDRNRKALGALKAKLRLSATEHQAAAQDKAESLGEFIGPMFPQAAIWSALKTTGKVAAAAPVVGRSASWLFNGGMRGDIVAGIGTNLIWNSQFEMPWLPKAEDVENFLSGDDFTTAATGAVGIVNSRVGNLLLDAGLGALLGRIASRGAAATPPGAQPSVPAPIAQGTSGGPPTIGPAGPLQTTPGALVSPAMGEVPLGYAAPDVRPDFFGWSGPGAKNIAPDVVSDNMPSAVRSTGVAFESLNPPSSSGTTVDQLLEAYAKGETKWLDEIPLPRQGENEFPNWQNLPAARAVRQQGTVLQKPDGSLIALFHEGSGGTEFSYAASKDQHLSGPGAFFRDRADAAYAEFAAPSGYGAKNMARSMGQYDRLSEMLETVGKQVEDLESLTRTKKKVTPEMARRLNDLQEQRALLQGQLDEIGTPSAATHPVFAVVKRPFYFDAAIDRGRVDEILNTIQTNPQFESLRPALNTLKPEMEKLFTQGPSGQAVDPMASQFHATLSQIWHTAEDGTTKVIGPRGVNDLLKATGYDAIHNIGGLRNLTAGNPVPTYNAWNLLDPENQIVRVFAPPPMAGDVAESTAIQLSKQAAVMESSVLDQIAERAVVSDADILTANISKNPFGVQVIRGVRDPANLMQRLAGGAVGVDGVVPSTYRLVPRQLVPNGAVTFDVMVSTGRPITDKMAKQFHDHGVFEGMHGIVGTRGQQVEVMDVFTATGAEKLGGKKLTPGTTYVTVQSLDTPLHAGKGKVRKNVYTVGLKSFLEKRMSDDSMLLQDPSLSETVGKFMAYAEQRLGTDFEGLLTADSMRKLPVLFEEYAAAKGLPPAARSIMGGLVEREIVSAARELAGTDIGMVDDTIREALDLIDDEPLDNVIQLAASRGLRAVPEAGSQRIILQGPRATQWVFESDDAARSFLQKYDVEARDLSPSGPVFPEISRSYEPEGLYRQGPTLAEEAEAAVKSGEFLESVISAEKLERNIMRDELGGNYWRSSGPPQPASALPWTPIAASGGVTSPPILVGQGAPPIQVGAGGGGMPPGGAPPLAFTGGAPNVPVPPNALGTQLRALSGNIARITHDLNNFVWQNVMPSRAFFDRMDELLEQGGAPILAPGQDMFNLRTNISKFYNESADQVEVLTRTMNQFQSRTNRSGNVWNALDLPTVPTPGVQLRQDFMTQRQFLAREMAAVAEIEAVGESVAGPQAWRELQAYVSSVKANMIMGAPNPYVMPPNLAAAMPNIQFFMQHAARRQLRLEVPDAGMILHEYIRSYHWDRVVAPEWAATQTKWRQVSNWTDFRGERVARPLADYVLGWMDGVENGFMPRSDVLLNGVQWTLEKFGIPLTKNETMNLIGGTMSSAYRALLGWNPYSVLRDSTQPLMAVPWVGIDNLGAAYREVAGAAGPAAQRAAWRAALDNGWTEKGIPPMLAANVDQSAIVQGLPLQQNQFTPAQEKIRELGQMIGDFAKDMVPPALRSIEGTKLDPLWAYTQQGVVARVVVGNAAAKRFDQVLGQANITVPQAIRTMGAKDFSRAQARHVEELLTAGKVAEARNVYANTVADMTMNRYGVKEGAIGNHNVLGRVGTQLGGHSSHQVAMFYNLARSGMASRTTLRMAMTIGAFTGAYKALEATTGWNWTKWHPLNWANSPQLGGPLVRPMGRLLGAASGLASEGVRAATGQESSEFNTQMIDRFFSELPNDLARFGGTLGAGARFGAQYNRAAQDGPEAVGRLMFTGDARDQTQYQTDSGLKNLYEYLNSGTASGKGAQ